MPGIVVGVDGSHHSHRALIWAMRQAAQQQVPLTVLAVRPDPVRPATGIYWGLRAYPEDSHNPEVARKAIEEIVEQARNEIGETAPEVTVNVVTGDPAEELIKRLTRRRPGRRGVPRQRRVRLAPDGFGEQQGHPPRGLPRRGHPQGGRPHRRAGPGGYPGGALESQPSPRTRSCPDDRRLRPLQGRPPAR